MHLAVASLLSWTHCKQHMHSITICKSFENSIFKYYWRSPISESKDAIIFGAADIFLLVSPCPPCPPLCKPHRHERGIWCSGFHPLYFVTHYIVKTTTMIEFADKKKHTHTSVYIHTYTCLASNTSTSSCKSSLVAAFMTRCCTSPVVHAQQRPKQLPEMLHAGSWRIFLFISRSTPRWFKYSFAMIAWHWHGRHSCLEMSQNPQPPSLIYVSFLKKEPFELFKLLIFNKLITPSILPL